MQLRKVINLSISVYQHLHFKGVFSVKVDDCNSFKMYHHGYVLENRIFWEGLLYEDEKESLKLWIKLCQDSKVIFDVGANTGLYALVAKSVQPLAAVYAFEPVKRIYEKLRRNNDINNYDINCINVAVSDGNRKMILHESASEHIYNATLNKQLHHKATHTIETEVETIKLSTFIKHTSITPPDLIKIDVERHEAKALRGLQPYLAENRPKILVEVISDEIARELENIISELSYIYFYIDELQGPVKVNQIRKKKNLNYLICPSETAASLSL